MQIVRVTIRTFQSAEHAELFLSVGNGVKHQLSNAGLKAKLSICQNISLPNQVISIWYYDSEEHMKAVRDLLSNQSRLPNSLVPKEVAYETKIVHIGEQG